MNRKNKDGSVEIGPLNFVTNPPRSGNKNYSGFEKYPEHKPDPFDRRKQFERNEAQAKRQAIKYDAWRPNSSHMSTFNSYKEVQGHIRLKEIPLPKFQKTYENLKAAHQGP